MKRTTIKINRNQLNAWMEKAVVRILKDLQNDDVYCGGNDYFTATDLVACVRLIADEQANESDGSDSWWGYNAWCRIKIVDKYHRETLMDLCRDFLRHQTGLTSHNFGRGHISGERYRIVGTDISDAEKKTIADKKKERPVHLIEGWQGEGQSRRRGLLCQANRKPKARGWRRSRSDARRTNEPEKVTCKRCLKLMTQVEEVSK